MSQDMNLKNEKRVYAVWSLDELKEIIAENEEFNVGNLLKRAFLTVWVFAANFSLGLLRFLLFEKWGTTAREFKNITVYTVGIVGDNVVMLPALAALRRRYPKAKITVITNCQIWDKEGARGILEPSPLKDHLIILDDHPVKRKGFRFQMDDGKFEGIECDLFVNLSPFGNRGWIGAVVREMIFAKMLGAKYAIGFRMSTYSRKGIFNKVQHKFMKNEPRRSREVLKELRLKPVEDEDLLTRDEAAKESILKKISQNGGDNRPIFVINPGAKFESKCWPPEYFAEVTKWVHQRRGSAVMITGVASEREIAQEVVRASGDFAINLAGETTVQELIELLRISMGCVTNDTGTMHLAAMVGIPTVAIFSTRISPTHWLPAGDSVVSILSFEDCSFCYKDECSHAKCLRNIDKNYVVQEIKKLLSKKISDRRYDGERTCPTTQTIQGYL
jgi:heptosyltransferase-2